MHSNTVSNTSQPRAQERGSRKPRFAVAVLAGIVLALGLGASAARPARSDQVTISLVQLTQAQPGFSVVISNFERVYPNITVNATYAATSSALSQLMPTELAAGSAPDLVATNAGCGTVISVCAFARDGYLAPLVNEPWVRWSLPAVTSASKYGQGLFAFVSGLSFEGLYTNDDMFKKLGLQVPQTFAQLLALCPKAKADGTIPLLLPAQGSTVVQHLLEDIALNTVYAGDKHWTRELKAGTVTFDGTAGWHAALQEFVDMNNAGCFGAGTTSTTSAAADGEFAAGQALMYFNGTTHYGLITAAAPQFAFSQRPFPAGNDPSRTVSLLEQDTGIGVNAHASAQNQAAAHLFIDFLARPAQDALKVKLG
jgi:raffinose/stachyose/melibiose transport system substrate-binding protein